MQYNGETNEQDIYHVALDWCDATETDYPIAKATPHANSGYMRFFRHLHRYSDDWNVQDTNDTTLLTATANLVSGQDKYTILDGAIAIKALEVSDASGNFSLLHPIDKQDLVARGISITEYMSEAGQPLQYDKEGRLLRIYPPPSYAYTAGLKLHFDAGVSIFTITDTTKEPGFDPDWHEIVPIEMALPYCMKYKQDRVQMLNARKQEIYDLAKFEVSHKSKDKPRILRTLTVDTQ